MKKVKALILAITFGLALGLSGCAEEVILPDEGNSNQGQTDPDG